jgi:hypothetical protein
MRGYMNHILEYYGRLIEKEKDGGNLEEILKGASDVMRRYCESLKDNPYFYVKCTDYVAILASIYQIRRFQLGV